MTKVECNKIFVNKQIRTDDHYRQGHLLNTF